MATDDFFRARLCGVRPVSLLSRNRFCMSGYLGCGLRSIIECSQGLRSANLPIKDALMIYLSGFFGFLLFLFVFWHLNKPEQKSRNDDEDRERGPWDSR